MSWHSKPEGVSWSRFVATKTSSMELEPRVKCRRQYESHVAAGEPEELAAWKALLDFDVIP